ncbi:penicillin-binding transpeptidase domain-containing protein, partial [Bacteriovoracales bacterium]|nr:penicillin-binding transpeptidase domain-containing protein [Bacteriovoracales bacterium]
RVLSKETTDALTDILVLAVEEGTGGRAKIPYFKIAGKTSTAQRPDKEGGYSGYIPGFVGYPVNVKDRFVVYVYIEKPEGEDYYGNRVAAPVFRKIAHYYLYKNKDFDELAFEEGINTKVFKSMVVDKAPTRLIGKKYAPDFIGLDKISANKLAASQSVRLLHKGIGLVISQRPSPGREFKGRRSVELIYSPPRYD